MISFKAGVGKPGAGCARYDPPLVIVTGFGRCGFSAMMAMLAAAIWQRPPGLAPEMMELERWKEDAA
jgi:hypothetical protein